MLHFPTAAFSFYPHLTWALSRNFYKLLEKYIPFIFFKSFPAMPSKRLCRRGMQGWWACQDYTFSEQFIWTIHRSSSSIFHIPRLPARGDFLFFQYLHTTKSCSTTKVPMHDRNTNNKLEDLRVQHPACQQVLQWGSSSLGSRRELSRKPEMAPCQMELPSTKACFLHSSSSSYGKSEVKRHSPAVKCLMKKKGASRTHRPRLSCDINRNGITSHLLHCHNPRSSLCCFKHQPVPLHSPLLSSSQTERPALT